MDSIGGRGEEQVDSDDSNKGCECSLDKFVRFLYTYQIQKRDVVSHYVGSSHILLLFNPYMIQRIYVSDTTIYLAERKTITTSDTIRHANTTGNHHIDLRIIREIQCLFH